MTSQHMRILAVVVLYRRKPEEAAPWPFICQALKANADVQPLTHCLIYDNSAEGLVEPALPEGFSYQSNPANGGTAAAYRAAVVEAAKQDCDWLLLLDQDTLLPKGYLERVNEALQRHAEPVPAVLVPRIMHQGSAVSPCVITPSGTVRPVLIGEPTGGIPTAISSGLVIRKDALAAHLPDDPVFWLDYLDHMIFLGLSRSGDKLGYVDARIDHHLSVQDPASLSILRLESILKAERAFSKALGYRALAMLSVRRLVRALRYLRHKPALSLKLLQSILR